MVPGVLEPAALVKHESDESSLLAKGRDAELCEGDGDVWCGLRGGATLAGRGCVVAEEVVESILMMSTVEVGFARRKLRRKGQAVAAAPRAKSAVKEMRRIATMVLPEDYVRGRGFNSDCSSMPARQ